MLYIQTSTGLLLNADHMMGHFISCTAGKTLLKTGFDTCIFMSLAVDGGVGGASRFQFHNN